MKIEGIKKYLDNRFVNSECMTFLETYLSKYDDILCDIDWVNNSYIKFNNANKIYYSYFPDIIIKIKTNNYHIGELTIKISRYHNNIEIIDNINVYNDLNKDITTVCKLSSFPDGNSVVSFNKYEQFNKKKQKHIEGVKLTFDKLGIMTDYHEYTDDNIYSINKYNSRIKNKRKRVSSYN